MYFRKIILAILLIGSLFSNDIKESQELSQNSDHLLNDEAKTILSDQENTNQSEKTQSQKKKEAYLLRGQLQEIKMQKDLQKQQMSKNGFFLGAGVGSGTLKEYNSSFHPLFVALKTGYQKAFFGDITGVRSYIEYDFINTLGLQANLHFYHTLSANLDFFSEIMLDKTHSYGIGFFGGIGFGGVYYHSEASKGNFSVFLNLGLSVIMKVAHRIDFTYRFPTAKGWNNFNDPSAFFVGYSYCFGGMK